MNPSNEKAQNKTQSKLWKTIKKHKNIYIMLIPIVAFYVIFCYIPILGNVIAFQDYKITRGFLRSDFVGLKHFSDFLNDVYFWRLIRNTVTINLYYLILGFPVPIILALLLNEVRSQTFKKSVQTITYMPHFISAVVVASMTLDFVSTEGFINSALMALGFDAVPFMSTPKYFYSIYTISGIWQSMGWSSIIYISALASVDQQLYEAAKVDGAGRWKQTIHITLPGILPTIIILFIMQIGSMLSVGYEKIILLYNPAIYETADVISTYIYRRGILGAEYGYSAAVSLFNAAINIFLLVTSNFLSKKFTETSLF